MSIRLMSAVFESKTLGPTERLIMLALADHADDDGRCYPSISRLCQRTGLSERAVRSNLRKLETQGYLHTEKGVGRGGTSLYSVSANPAAGAPFDDKKGAASAPGSKCPPAAGAPLDGPEKGQQVPEKGHLVPEKGQQVPPNRQEPPRSRTEAEDAGAREIDMSLIGKLTHALGFDHHGIVPKYWISPDAPLIVARWQTDLRLTADEIIHVAVQNMRAHGSPANGPKTLTRHMQDFAAARDAPALTPTAGIARTAPPQGLTNRELGEIAMARLEAERNRKAIQ